MRSVCTFVKYSEKLLADINNLTPLEKYLIYELSNPDVGTFFEEEWVRKIIRRLDKKYGEFVVDAATVEVEHASEEVEDVIFDAVREALKEHGFVDYYGDNPFRLAKEERIELQREIERHRVTD